MKIGFTNTASSKKPSDFMAVRYLCEHSCIRVSCIHLTDYSGIFPLTYLSFFALGTLFEAPEHARQCIRTVVGSRRQHFDCHLFLAALRILDIHFIAPVLILNEHFETRILFPVLLHYRNFLLLSH